MVFLNVPTNIIILFRSKSIPIDKTYDTAVYDEIQSDWVKVVPVFQTTIAIDTNNLQVGDTYTLCLYDIHEYQFGASDENAIPNIIICNDYSLCLSSYDPNDAVKDKQWVSVCNGIVRIGDKPHKKYDTSESRGYILSVLPEWSGYSFKILDHSLREVLFRIAWIHHNNELVAEVSDYENAVTLITTF